MVSTGETLACFRQNQRVLSWCQNRYHMSSSEPIADQENDSSTVKELIPDRCICAKTFKKQLILFK